MTQLHRNGCWLKVFILLLCVVGTVIAEDPVADQPETTAADAANPLADNLKQLPGTVINETKELVSDWDNVWPLMLAGGASIVMHNSNIDREIAENFDLHHALGKEIDEVGYIVGGPGLHFAAAGLWYLVSDNNQDEFNRQRAWTMIEALSVTGATTLGLKLIRDNDTPNGKWLAWPSGHTSSSFTVAAVLDEFYGPEVGFWSYLGAGFIGYRMMDSGDHWASDVVFGAVLGYLVGHQVAGKHMKLEIGGFNVVPINTVSNDEHIVGIGLAKRF
jgi:hypothetical protein